MSHERAARPTELTVAEVVEHGHRAFVVLVAGIDFEVRLYRCGREGNGMLRLAHFGLPEEARAAALRMCEEASRPQLDLFAEAPSC